MLYCIFYWKIVVKLLTKELHYFISCTFQLALLSKHFLFVAISLRRSHLNAAAFISFTYENSNALLDKGFKVRIWHRERVHLMISKLDDNDIPSFASFKKKKNSIIFFMHSLRTITSHMDRSFPFSYIAVL